MRFLLLMLIGIFIFSNEIYVASASSNAYALPEIIKVYNKKYSDKVRLIFASSGKLTAQILHGAKYDIFLAANMKYPLFLYKRGLTLTKPKIYAKGLIVLFSKKPIKGNYKEIILKSTSIAVANPKTAPYGRAAVEFLENENLYNKVKDKLVYAETVSAAFNYTLHSTDIGIIAKSLLLSPYAKKYKKNYLDLPKDYTSINQGVVLLDNKAKNFYNFLFSKEAKEIFKKYGYLVEDN
jgi:molybdate transport system substrate-binding protein